jgi:hypothetical protein
MSVIVFKRFENRDQRAGKKMLKQLVEMGLGAMVSRLCKGAFGRFGRGERVGAFAEALEARAFMTASLSMTFDAMHPLSYHDEVGNKVTLSLTGAGTGTAYFEDWSTKETLTLVEETGDHILSVSIDGSNSNTGFRVDVVGDSVTFGTATTIIPMVHVAGDVGSVYAPRLSIHNSLTIDGGAGSIMLGDQVGGVSSLSFGASKAFAAGTKVTLGHAENFSISAPEARIAQLVATDWRDTDSSTDVIIAASIDMLVINGDFESGLDLSGEGVADDAPTLNLANIAGVIRNGVWKVAGNVERITSRLGGDHWTLDATGLVAYLTTSRSLIESTIHAQSLGLLSVRQHVLDTTITTGNGLDADLFSIAGVSVGGTVIDSSIDSQNTGVGTILITGNIMGLGVSASTLTRLNTGVSMYNSDIDVSKVGTIFVSLDMVESSITATAALADDVVSMGNLTVFAIAREVFVESSGSVDNMRFGHLLDSRVLVGADDGEGLFFSQTESGEFARINTLYLSATLGYTSEKAMRDSDILVGHLGAVRIYSVDDSGETVYGISAMRVDSYQRRLANGTVLKLTDLENDGFEPETVDEAGGYRLTILPVFLDD